MSVHEIIQNRRSVRTYDPEGVVTDDQLRQLLTAAMLAPSACNQRPWAFLVIRDPALKQALMAVHPFCRMLATAQAAIVVLAKPAPEGDMAHDFFPQDCGAATQNILLEAQAMGLGTCWCGVYPKEALIKRVRHALGLGPEDLPFNVIAVGVPGEQPKQRGLYEEDRVRWL